jgi:cyclohexyl-isocyanide hydratase
MSNFNVGFVIFPNLTQLDLTGPLQVLARLPESTTHIIAKSQAPVPSDCGLGLVPTHTFANCPPLDLICIPGGVSGVIGAISDRETIEFVRRQAGGAKYVTSVCTGAFILGVAGLLKGRRVTTHWAYTDLLPLIGATYEKARVVKDGNVITAGGVTSGIDFGLSVIAEIAGEPTAHAIQLGIEYDPAPPFDSGHPDRAPAASNPPCPLAMRRLIRRSVPVSSRRFRHSQNEARDPPWDEAARETAPSASHADLKAVAVSTASAMPIRVPGGLSEAASCLGTRNSTRPETASGTST